MRQGCPLSPVLFTTYIRELERVLRKGQDEGAVIGSKKIWSLAFADDIALVAESVEGLNKMIGRFTRFMERRELEISKEKSKVMVFSKSGRKSKERWDCGGVELQEVNTYTYLGMTFCRNGNYENHVKERVRKADMAMRCIWGITERYSSQNVWLRLTLFDRVVKSILLYGAKVWGFKEYKQMEGLQERYLRWLLECIGLPRGI